MDGVVPYRLEMGAKGTGFAPQAQAEAKAAIAGHRNLYDFWGDDLYREVMDESRILINLASKEYSKCIEKDPSKLALDLEDTVVITAPLISWSIAGTVPLASVGAPLASIPLAVYLYLLPLWRLAGEGICGREQVRCLT